MCAPYIIMAKCIHYLQYNIMMCNNILPMYNITSVQIMAYKILLCAIHGYRYSWLDSPLLAVFYLSAFKSI